MPPVMEVTTRHSTSIKVQVLLGFFPRDQGFASILRDGLAKIAEVLQVLDAVTQHLQLAVDLFQGQRLKMIGGGGVTHTLPFGL